MTTESGDDFDDLEEIEIKPWAGPCSLEQHIKELLFGYLNWHARQEEKRAEEISLCE